MKLTLGASPCPNDCFIIDAIVNRRIDLEGLEVSLHLADVEALNRMAFAGELDVTKLSYYAYAFCADRYVALNAGSALGRGCGPLLIARRQIALDQVAGGEMRVAIPGRYTTANFLLEFAFPQARHTIEMVFSEIEGSVLAGTADAGVIIHENRFTYAARGLKKIIDLGEHWEAQTGSPIPLGGIVVTRALPEEARRVVDRVLRRSVEFALANPEASMPFVRQHAQEMSDEVMRQHIELYVNYYSVDLGDVGRRAVERLFEQVAASGRAPGVTQPMFVA